MLKCNFFPRSKKSMNNLKRALLCCLRNTISYWNRTVYRAKITPYWSRTLWTWISVLRQLKIRVKNQNFTSEPILWAKVWSRALSDQGMHFLSHHCKKVKKVMLQVFHRLSTPSLWGTRNRRSLRWTSHTIRQLRMFLQFSHQTK